jgi:DNA-binding MurR/RpiR family transcriptional regulator
MGKTWPASDQIRDYEGLRAALVARQSRLSRRLQQVARFCLNHPEEVAINTLVRLADLAQVPPATITRFAKEMGFQGFAELQSVFRERLLGPRLPYAPHLAEPGDMVQDADLSSPGRVFSGFVQAAVSSLVRLEQSGEIGDLVGFVDAMATAEVVHVAAARGAFGIGAYLVYGLASIGKRAHLVDNLGAMRVAQVAAAGPSDVVLVITFDDYTPETVEVAQIAHERGVSVLAITDNALSPVVPLAGGVLYVTEARLGHFRSQVPAMVVCQSVIVSLGRKMALAGTENETK